MQDFFIGIHKFTPNEIGEIGFEKGERLEVLERDERWGDGWWTGINAKGEIGLFPSTFTIPYHPESESDDVSGSDDIYSNINIIKSQDPSHSRATTLSLNTDIAADATPSIATTKRVHTWTHDEVIDWLHSITTDPIAISIFREYEISGPDLDLLNHSKLHVIGISDVSTRVAILSALTKIGVDVPLQPTVLNVGTTERRRQVRDADKNKSLPTFPIVQQNENHSREGSESEESFQSIRTTKSTFTISDYYQNPSAAEELVSVPTLLGDTKSNLQAKDSLAKSVSFEEDKDSFKDNRGYDVSFDMNTVEPCKVSLIPMTAEHPVRVRKGPITSLFSSFVQLLSRRTKRTNDNGRYSELILPELAPLELNISSAVMSSRLHVKVGDSLIWMMRHCILIDSVIYISKSDEKFIPILVVPITNHSLILPSSQKRSFAFQYTTSADQTIHFACSSQLEMMAWLNVLVRSATHTLERSKSVRLIPIANNRLSEIVKATQLKRLSPEIDGLEHEKGGSVPIVPDASSTTSGMKGAKYLPQRPARAFDISISSIN